MLYVYICRCFIIYVEGDHEVTLVVIEDEMLTVLHDGERGMQEYE
jgi:hypothetical protein